MLTKARRSSAQYNPTSTLLRQRFVAAVALLLWSFAGLGSNRFQSAYATPAIRTRASVSHVTLAPAWQGCAYHCATDTAVFQVWQPKKGTPDRFIAQAIGKWRTMEGEFELLPLMGQSSRGLWSVETQLTDAGGELYTDLVCTTA